MKDNTLALRRCMALLFAMSQGPAMPTKKLKKRHMYAFDAVVYISRYVDIHNFCEFPPVRERGMIETALFMAGKLSADLRKSRINPWHLPLLDAINRALAE